MGMFDILRCDMPLPSPWPRKDFQTKTFDCQSDLYVITADGRLIQTAAPQTEGQVLRNPVVDTEVPFDGEIEFYDVAGSEWVKFATRFVLGCCDEIRLVERGSVASLGPGKGG